MSTLPCLQQSLTFLCCRHLLAVHDAAGFTPAVQAKTCMQKSVSAFLSFFMLLRLNRHMT